MDPVELDIHIAGTAAFIAADPVSLIMQTYGRTSDGAGGTTLAAVSPARSAITARLIPQSDEVPEIMNSDGVMAKPRFVILGMPTTDFRKDDRFVYQGSTYCIAQIHTGPAYEKKGDVIRIV